MLAAVEMASAARWHDRATLGSFADRRLETLWIDSVDIE
jgi:hypothetical protein